MLERFPAISRELDRSNLAYNSSTPVQFSQCDVVCRRGGKSGLNRFIVRAVWISGLAGALLLLSGLFVGSVQALVSDLERYVGGVSPSHGHIMPHNVNVVPGGSVGSLDRAITLEEDNTLEQEFTTGPHPLGYRLTYFMFSVGVTRNESFETKLYQRGSLVANLTSSTGSPGDKEFRTWVIWPPSSGVNLQSGTTYMLFVGNNSQGAQTILGYTGTYDLADTGWSVADTSSHTATVSTDTVPAQIRV